MKKLLSLLVTVTMIASMYFTVAPLPQANAAGVSLFADLPPGVDANDPMAQIGALDVTKAPYSADHTGIADATASIQSAVNDSVKYNMPVYFPSGTYLVSDTIDAQTTAFYDGSHKVGITLVGATTGPARPVIKLADHAAGFDGTAGPFATDDGTNVKPVIRFWKKDASGNEDPASSYNNVVRGIDFQLGQNPGAVAIRHQGGEGSAIQDVSIDASGAFAGLYDMPAGGGASVTDLAVEGGKYGVYIESTLPAPLMTGLTLHHQTVASLYYEGKSPLTVVGFEMVKDSGPAVILQNPGSGANGGGLSLVDGSLSYTAPQSAESFVRNDDRMLYMRSVYFKNAGYAVSSSADPNSDLPIDGGAIGSWHKLAEYSYSESGSSVLIDGSYAEGSNYPDSGVNYSEESPPADLIARHVWPEGEKFTAFDQPGLINVKMAPYNAVGDGMTNDSAAIQNAIDDAAAGGNKVLLPRGRYFIKDQIKLQANTQLFGVSKTASFVTVVAVTNGATLNGKPAVDTAIIAAPDNAAATSVIANFKIGVPNQNQRFYPIGWAAGQNSIVKDIDIDNPTGSQSPTVALKWIKITGSGGGRWYNLFPGSQNAIPDAGMRIISVDSTTSPLLFYTYDAQNGRTKNKPLTEILNASNVTIFAAKLDFIANATNVSSSALVINQSANINVIGVGSAGANPPKSEYIRLNDTGDPSGDNNDITIANMARNNVGSAPWNYVNETYGEVDTSLPADAQAALFKRGSSTIEMPSNVEYKPVASVTLSETVKTLEKNSSFILKPTILPADATIKAVHWSSSDPTIAGVDNTGKVTGKNVGVARITVTTADGAMQAYCDITVIPAKTIPDGVDPNNVLYKKGLLDITAAPYFADATGATDATAAIQTAVADAFRFNLQVYFPSGTYTVSDTIEAKIPSNQLNELRKGNTLVGSTTGSTRPVIRLANNAPGFDLVNGTYPIDGGAARIKPVIHFWRESDSVPGVEVPNENYNNVIRGIDFDLGQNPGAVAIRHQGCEGSAIEDVKIDARHAFAGVYDLIGSGGSITDLEVIGGQYGVYARESQPAPLITGLKLSGQTNTAIYYQGKSPLTVVGFEIVKDNGPVVRINKSGSGTESSGMINLVDGSIRLSSPQGAATVVQNTDRSVYLRDVYVKNAGFIIRHSANPNSDIPVASSDIGSWIRIDEYAFDKGYTPNQVMLVDGGYVTGTTYPASGPYYNVYAFNPPGDLVSRHVWTNAEQFIAFDQPGVINVKDAPYNAKGDGASDDTAAIQSAIDTGSKVFLPKGKYLISSALRLKADTQLFGVSKSASIIGVLPTSKPAVDTPIIASPDDPAAATALANVGLELPARGQLYYAIDWQAGQYSIVKDIWIKPADIQANAPNNASLKWVIIHGNGGGRWYNLVAPGQYGPVDAGYRIQYIENTVQPLIFYMFHSQHARTMNNDPQAEIRNSANITMFSAKFEKPNGSNDANVFSSALEIDGSRNINIIGNSGVLQPLKNREIVKLNDTGDSANDNEDITIAGMGKNNGGTPGWFYVKEFYQGQTAGIPGNNVGTLFKRGHSTIAMPYVPSSDDTLLDLKLDNGIALTPAFDPETRQYSASVPYRVSAVGITPSVSSAVYKSLTINGVPTVSGATYSGSLTAGATTTFTVVVTAEDGITARPYTIAISRPAPNHDATLSGLAISTDKLSPAFSPDKTKYNATVAYSVETIAFTPTAAFIGSLITINGKEVVSGSPYTVPLDVLDNTFDIMVTAEDGTVIHYEVMVHRLPNENSNGNGNGNTIR